MRKKSMFGVNLKYLRSWHSLTQEKMSEKLKIKRSTIGAYEEDRSEPGLLQAHLISKLFGVSMEDMITKEIKKK